MEGYLEKAERFEEMSAMPDRIQALALIAIAEELRALRDLLEWKFLPAGIPSRAEREQKKEDKE